VPNFGAEGQPKSLGKPIFGRVTIGSDPNSPLHAAFGELHAALKAVERKLYKTLHIKVSVRS
jgi:hypothetical protein